MKKRLVFFALCFHLALVGFAQQKQLCIVKMNNALDNKSESFTLYEKLGSIENRQGGYTYRARLEYIGSIEMQSTEDNFVVNVICNDEQCITMVKGDTSTTSTGSTAYFFSTKERATAFAQQFCTLVKNYNPEVKTNVALETTAEKKEEPITTTKEENNRASTKTIATPPKKEVEEQEETDEEEKTQKPRAKKEIVKENEDDGGEDKNPVARPVRTKAKKENDDEVAEDKETKKTDKSVSGMCRQLEQIIGSGASSNFKSIEGGVLNTITKTNECTVKLKGAKRNYISTHQNKRAFVGEMKSSKDYELLMIAYDELQAEIDNCLGPDWEFSDKSSDEEYADFNGDVRDTEYKNTTKDLPKVRIILITDDDNKFTLFVRIQ